MGSYMGPIWAPHMGLRWDLQHDLMSSHKGKPKWVTNGNHMGPILDLAQVAHVQPTFVNRCLI